MRLDTRLAPWQDVGQDVNTACGSSFLQPPRSMHEAPTLYHGSQARPCRPSFRPAPLATARPWARQSLLSRQGSMQGGRAQSRQGSLQGPSLGAPLATLFSGVLARPRQRSASRCRLKALMLVSPGPYLRSNG